MFDHILQTVGFERGAVHVHVPAARHANALGAVYTIQSAPEHQDCSDGSDYCTRREPAIFAIGGNLRRELIVHLYRLVISNSRG